MICFRQTVFLTLLLCGLFSCETVQKYSDKAFELFGLEKKSLKPTQKTPATSLQSPSKTRARSSPKVQDKPLDKTSETSSEKPAPNEEFVVLTKKTDEEPQTVQKKDLKTAKKAEFRVEAPVHVQKRVGGVAKTIFSDENYLYLDFPQHLAIYDKNFKPLGQKRTAFPVRDIKRIQKQDKTLLYLKEENNVLEILEWTETPSENVTVSLKELSSYEMGGDFFWIDNQMIVVLFSDKMQILDFTNFDDVRILTEIAAREVSDLFAKGNSLYLARNDFLDIYDLKEEKLLSSLKIGKPFQFLRMTGQTLILGFKDKDQNLIGLQRLNLSEDFTKIVTFGNHQTFPVPLSGFYFHPDQIILAKDATDKKAPVGLFHIGENRFLRGPLTTETNLMTWALFEKLYLVTSDQISINAFELNEEVIQNTKSLQALQETQKQGSSGVPLAQIGAEKTIADEYQISTANTVECMADAKSVVLLDANHLIIFQKRTKEKTDQILATTRFLEDDFELQEPKTDKHRNFEKVKATDFGLLAFDEEEQKIFFLDVEFKEWKTLPNLSLNGLLSWFHFSSAEGEILVTSSKTSLSEKKGKNSSQTKATYLLQTHLLKSPTEVTPLAKILYPEKPFLFQTGSNEILILTRSDLVFYSLEDFQKGTLIEIDKTLFKEAFANIIDAKIAPTLDKLYVLSEIENRLKIFVFSIDNPERKIILEDFEITPSQFARSSFSKGGQLFILPTTEGTLFYDMTYLDAKTEAERTLAHWPEPSEAVDVANAGQFLCVALGPKGVYCGELLFY